ncbi:hypothetical protein PR202_gb06562 [Eleusine coracana subsp. coracana]|uniref:Uncharacterized protein n=1 Tax=Eleusine coracana subsp. coracana TaxID=191504 RepID=A0AAV5E9S9_ELECO|nr:hypothetical protein PR202_gb06562 [Eleusine coracana subsp. coracana]
MVAAAAAAASNHAANGATAAKHAAKGAGRPQPRRDLPVHGERPHAPSRCSTSPRPLWPTTPPGLRVTLVTTPGNAPFARPEPAPTLGGLYSQATLSPALRRDLRRPVPDLPMCSLVVVYGDLSSTPPRVEKSVVQGGTRTADPTGRGDDDDDASVVAAPELKIDVPSCTSSTDMANDLSVVETEKDKDDAGEAPDRQRRMRQRILATSGSGSTPTPWQFRHLFRRLSNTGSAVQDRLARFIVTSVIHEIRPDGHQSTSTKRQRLHELAKKNIPLKSVLLVALFPYEPSYSSNTWFMLSLQACILALVTDIISAVTLINLTATVPVCWHSFLACFSGASMTLVPYFLLVSMDKLSAYVILAVPLPAMVVALVNRRGLRRLVARLLCAATTEVDAADRKKEQRLTSIVIAAVLFTLVMQLHSQKAAGIAGDGLDHRYVVLRMLLYLAAFLWSLNRMLFFHEESLAAGGAAGACALLWLMVQAIRTIVVVLASPRSSITD